MSLERFVCMIDNFALRKPIKRVCYSSVAVDRLIAAYKRRNPSATISVRRKRLMIEVVDGLRYATKEFSELPVNVPLQWSFQMGKVTMVANKQFEATVEEVDKLISEVQEDPSIVAISLWLVTNYP